MHRGYTKESYLERIDRLREVCPSIAITGDVIVGFPGEEDEDFKDTLDLMERVQFDDLFSFKYSPRKGTRAAQFENQVEERGKTGSAFHPSEDPKRDYPSEESEPWKDKFRRCWSKAGASRAIAM